MFYFNEIICVCIFKMLLVSSYKNNVCTDFSSYFYADFSKNCYYARDVNYGTNDRIIMHILKSETHKIVTEDGYILDIFRLPRKNSKKVAIMMHPLTTSSMVWMMQSNESTALWFYQQGYDVWLPNNRGTKYGIKHLKYTTNDSQFWDFSHHEIGFFDHKAAIDYIYAKTGQTRAVFVGHSLSTTTGLIYASLHPEDAQEKLKIMLSMGTVAYMTRMRSPIHYLIKFVPLAELLFKVFPWKGIYTEDSVVFKLIPIVKNIPFNFLVPYGASILGGWNPFEFDPRWSSIPMSILDGSSIKLYFHYGQQSQNFAWYNYGREKNLKLYNQTTPPEYPVERIKTPIYLITGENDYFASTEDVDILYGKLGQMATIYGQMKIPKYNHFDYQTGIHRWQNVYEPIFKLLETI